MTIGRDDTADLQRILDILQVNPSLISVDAIQSFCSEAKIDENQEEDSCDSEDESLEKVQNVNDKDDLNKLGRKLVASDKEGCEVKSLKRKLGNEESEDPKRQK